jgi:hypothetical protein
MDSFVRLQHIRPGAFFYKKEDDIPAGYQSLSHELERFAAAYLQGPKARMTFRLFILGHGDARATGRTDQPPLYSTTCGVVTPGSGRKAKVIDRVIDYDFAQCPVNGGCGKCR